MSALVKILWAAVLLFSPLYYFESGSPQISDFLAVIFMFSAMVALVFGDWKIPFQAFQKWYMLLVLWVCVVNLSWALILSSEAFFMPTVYYIFNFTLSITLVYCLAFIPGFYRLTLSTVALALILSGVGVLISLDGQSRTAGFFNNPNQLSYYSLLGCAILLIGHNFQIKGGALYYLAMLSGVVSIIVSASMAAVAGLIFLILAIVYSQFNFSSKGVGWGILTVVAMVVCLRGLDFLSDGSITSIVESRLDRAPEKIERFYGERLYNRITANPKYLLLGAGEGDYASRFYPFSPGEIHSSLGTLLFAYGVFGVLFFLALLHGVLRHAPVQAWMVVSAPMVYSFAHMGLRTTFFWILLVLVWYRYNPQSYAVLRRLYARVGQET